MISALEKDTVRHEENEAETDSKIASGAIKWFDRRRGFGFILPEDGTDDILIHCSTIEPHGRRELPEGCVVECEFRDGPKGRHVVKLVSFDPETLGDCEDAARKLDRRLRAIDVDENFIAAKVKWFSRVRGYGFLEAEEIDADIFLHMETLREAGFTAAAPDDVLLIQVGEGEKGPLAVCVREDVSPHA